ncbi:MAG TPA: TMEM175 family protein [Rhizomicrobium sp.]|nr:TMEM175 family protein [Rhizomicrobium sp.]
MSGAEELETEGGLQRRLDRHAYDRLIILSDGVFAIAITLAAFEIKAPANWRDLAELWAQLRLPVFAYLLSFGMVASYWNSQRTLFARLVRVDTPLTLLALLQLLFIALIPVATGLFYDHSKQIGSPTIYLATLAACGYVTAALWFYAALRPAMMHPQSRARDYWERFAKALVAPLAMTWFAATGDQSTASMAGIVALLLVCRLVFWRRRGIAQK